MDRIVYTLKYCKLPKSRPEILEALDLTQRFNNFKVNIQPAVESGWLEMTIPDKPKSKNQKYRTTEAGKEILKDNHE